MKKLLTVTVAVLLTLSILCLAACTENEGEPTKVEGNFEYELFEDNTAVKIVYYRGKNLDVSLTEIESDVTIPSTIEGKPVTEIGYGAFERSDSLVHVTIPNTVTEIAECAFADCYHLTSITLTD
ncbi:MAG: leucine-rich repeat protein, partial [Clostridia bacterium]|nr:leucine-rich repeat protein [Clostridia bacterium]